jgi:spore coat polysaccharide biosynthesis protein SpsF
MGSTRLPGKVLMPFSNGKNLLDYQIECLSDIFNSDQIYIATTINPENDVIKKQYAEKVQVYQGSEEDVLSRYVDIAKKSKAMHIIRMSSDNPFIFPEGVELMLRSHYHRCADYTSYIIDNIPVMLTTTGMFCEIIRSETIQAIHKVADSREREHVTLAIYTRLIDRFKINFLDVQTNFPLLANRAIRLTVDTSEDFNMINSIIQRLNLDNKMDLKSLNKIIDYLHQTNLIHEMVRESLKPDNKKIGWPCQKLRANHDGCDKENQG